MNTRLHQSADFHRPAFSSRSEQHVKRYQCSAVSLFLQGLEHLSITFERKFHWVAWLFVRLFRRHVLAKFLLVCYRARFSTELLVILLQLSFRRSQYPENVRRSTALCDINARSFVCPSVHHVREFWWNCGMNLERKSRSANRLKTFFRLWIFLMVESIIRYHREIKKSLATRSGWKWEENIC